MDPRLGWAVLDHVEGAVYQRDARDEAVALAHRLHPEFFGNAQRPFDVWGRVCEVLETSRLLSVGARQPQTSRPQDGLLLKKS